MKLLIRVIRYLREKLPLTDICSSREQQFNELLVPSGTAEREGSVMVTVRLRVDVHAEELLLAWWARIGRYLTVGVHGHPCSNNI